LKELAVFDINDLSVQMAKMVTELESVTEHLFDYSEDDVNNTLLSLENVSIDTQYDILEKLFDDLQTINYGDVSSSDLIFEVNTY